MEKRDGCDWAGVAIPVQLRQRFKPCCPVFAVFKDCADCSGCFPSRVVVLARKKRDFAAAERNTRNQRAWRGSANRIKTTHDRGFGDEHRRQHEQFILYFKHTA